MSPMETCNSVPSVHLQRGLVTTDLITGCNTFLLWNSRMVMWIWKCHQSLHVCREWASLNFCLSPLGCAHTLINCAHWWIRNQSICLCQDFSKKEKTNKRKKTRSLGGGKCIFSSSWKVSVAPVLVPRTTSLPWCFAATAVKSNTTWTC